VNDRKDRLKDTLSHIDIKSIVLAIVVFIVFLGIAVAVGMRSYAAEKEVLRQQGELNANESALEYERNLLTRVDIITLIGYIVDQKLIGGVENSEIEKYLIDETENIIATLDPTTTGLYGWINGEYLDGAGWVPDDDYVATERPWYIQTLNSDDKITFVEPYLDMQTNTVMMTVSQLLSDGKSVLAMDVSLDPLQRIVEEISTSINGSQAFVIDKTGVVIVHSDKQQIGRNYLDEPDSFGGAVAKRIFKDGERQFDIETDEGNFSVYVDELEGGWYSVSLINADIWYRPLQRTIIVFAVILALIVGGLILLFVRLSAKNIALQRLHTRISQNEKREEELQILSETDRMTGLNDRVSGKHKVDELLSVGCEGMFLELDIDKFKSINDTFGHQVGDLVILAVADALRKTFRTNDIVMRLGGDEFGVFALGINDRSLGKMIIKRLFAQLSTHEIPELGHEEISISVGAVFCEGKNEPTFDNLYASADTALYVSKKTPGNSMTFSS
jgi:diguanylate cyclase (GGDEF)-like protein